MITPGVQSGVLDINQNPKSVFVENKIKAQSLEHAARPRKGQEPTRQPTKTHPKNKSETSNSNINNRILTWTQEPQILHLRDGREQVLKAA